MKHVIGAYTEYYIEFDGGQLSLRTDVDRVSRFVETTYLHMLVDRGTSRIGEISVMRTPDGYSVSPEVHSLGGEVVVNLDGEDVEPLLPLLKEEVLLRFIRARRDLLWLHAGAVARNDEALVICGRSGSGKSTLVTLLCERGWQLMSDDVAPILMNADEVLPFFQTPLRRIYPGRVVHEDEVGMLDREAVEVTPAMLRRQPARIKALVFPEFTGEDSAELRLLTSGDAALETLRNARNIVDHKAAAVERAAVVARRIPAYSLRYRSSEEGALLLDSLP